ncbi:MAG: hypothetical protein M1404_01950, partial [Acidobacteria bacterium]|nr:hypothetical protein [Acidobacteriota bacterium]
MASFRRERVAETSSCLKSVAFSVEFTENPQSFENGKLRCPTLLYNVEPHTSQKPRVRHPRGIESVATD